jgi:hypothetical protein
VNITDKYVLLLPIQIPDLKVKQVACGDDHTVLADLNDNIWVFGNIFLDNWV